MMAELIILFGIIIFAIMCLFYFIWLVSSAREQEWQAFRRGLMGLVPILAVVLIFMVVPDPWRRWISCIFILLLAWVMSIIVFPEPRIAETGDRQNIEPFDERDVIFSRWRYTAGTPMHATYYGQHPELLDIDEEIRNKPRLFKPGGLFYDGFYALAGSSEFERLHWLSEHVDGPVAEHKHSFDPVTMSHRLKTMIRALGAHGAGITELNQGHVYTHVGRGPGKWGSRITLNHTHAIAFTLEMDYLAVQKAPTMTTVVETGRRYVEGAIISIVIANMIRSMARSC